MLPSLNRFISAAALCAVSAATHHIGAATNLIGFSAAQSAEQLTVEQKFDAQLSADDQRAWMEQMSSAPNHVGSPHDRANAEFVLAKFREWGWEAHIEKFSVLYPTPVKTGLELIQPVRFTAALNEPSLEGDRTSTNTSGAIPPFVAYGGDGDVTGELVYVNTGMPDDYKELERRGISVEGKIVIARYGGGWRGLKPKLAHEHGAIGCIIYSDPHDDGYGEGDVWPSGAERPARGVQRGSVEDLPVAPGDPLTIGIGATDDAPRANRADAKTILKIPTLPVSYADAEPLLRALGGPAVPSSWRGALPITYHFGPGPARVHLTVQADWSRKDIYDVIATIRGSEFPDEWIIRGNHHDGWVFGASDPLSAHGALMSEAKAIGALLKEGWRPRRTLVYASWDGEEPGLLGSTEWAETHAAELEKKAVLYINSDGNTRGFLFAGGSHSLERLAQEAARSVRDPETGTNVLARARARILAEAARRKSGAEDALAKRMLGGDAPPVVALGSGSDFTPFLQHLGIATLDLGFGGEGKSGGVYHSAYDSFDHFIRFGDPDFSYGVALANTIGRVALRAANAPVIPMRFAPFAAAVAEYTREIKSMTENLRAAAEFQQRAFEENAFKLAADPKETDHAPEQLPEVPYLDFAPLENAVARLKKCAGRFDRAAAKLEEHSPEKSNLADLNAILQSIEQSLLRQDGLPGRPWYKHMIYAPGLFTGYGVKTLPGLREAIEEHRWNEAEQFARIIADRLNACSDRLDRARETASTRSEATRSDQGSKP